MLRICSDKLSIEKITDCWSREIQPRASCDELLDLLEAAWWRGELKTDGPLTPLALLRSIFRSVHKGELTMLGFIINDATKPNEIVLVEEGPLAGLGSRHYIPVPSHDPETWAQASCAAAFEELAQTPSRKHYPDRKIQFLMMKIDRHQFVRLVTAYGLDVPKFWRPPFPKPLELTKEDHISIGCKPPSEGQSAPGALNARRRGRKPRKFEQAKEAMSRDIREGRHTVASLDALLEKDLVNAYGGFCRETMRKARTAALLEFVEDAMKRDIREGRRTAASLRTMRERETGETYGVSPDIASKARTAVLSEIVE